MRLNLTDSTSTTIKARYSARDDSGVSTRVPELTMVHLSGWLPSAVSRPYLASGLPVVYGQMHEAETQWTEFKWIHSAFDRYWKWILPPVKTNNAFPLEVH